MAGLEMPLASVRFSFQPSFSRSPKPEMSSRSSAVRISSASAHICRRLVVLSEELMFFFCSDRMALADRTSQV